MTHDLRPLPAVRAAALIIAACSLAMASLAAGHVPPQAAVAWAAGSPEPALGVLPAAPTPTPTPPATSSLRRIRWREVNF